jgi:hypothetical protein
MKVVEFYEYSVKLGVVMFTAVTDILHSVTSRRSEGELWKIEFVLPSRV